MDIGTLDKKENHFDEPVEVVLYDANGEPEKDSQGNVTAVFVVGEFSKPAKKNERLNQIAVTRLVRQHGGLQNIPEADSDHLRAMRVAAQITGWRGFEANAEPFPYSADNALALVKGLMQHEPAQLQRIQVAQATHASFFTKPSAI